MSLEPGRYVCVRTRSWTGRIIRMATQSAYDHALITGDGGTVIQAAPSKGVHVGRLAGYAGCLMASNADEPMTPAQRERVVSAALAYCGEEYNWDAIASDALDALGWHWRLLVKIAGAGKRLVCSQLVAQAGSDAGFPSWRCGKDSAASVTPGDLASRPGVEVVSG